MSEKALHTIIELLSRGKHIVGSAANLHDDGQRHEVVLKAGQLLSPKILGRCQSIGVRALDVTIFDSEPSGEQLDQVVQSAVDEQNKAAQEQQANKKKQVSIPAPYERIAASFNLNELIDIVRKHMEGRAYYRDDCLLQTAYDWITVRPRVISIKAEDGIDVIIDNSPLGMIKSEIKGRLALAFKHRKLDGANPIVDLIQQYTGERLFQRDASEGTETDEQQYDTVLSNFDMDFFTESLDMAIITIGEELARSKKYSLEKKKNRDEANIPYFILAQLFHNLCYTAYNSDIAYVLASRASAYMKLYQKKLKDRQLPEDELARINESYKMLISLTSKSGSLSHYDATIRCLKRLLECTEESDRGLRSYLSGMLKQEGAEKVTAAMPGIRKAVQDRDMGSLREIVGKFLRAKKTQLEERIGAFVRDERFKPVMDDFHSDISFLVAHMYLPEDYSAITSTGRNYILWGIRYSHGNQADMDFIDKNTDMKRLDVIAEVDMKEGSKHKIALRDVISGRNTDKLPNACIRLAILNNLYGRVIAGEFNGDESANVMAYDGRKLMMAISELSNSIQLEALVMLVKEYHRTGESQVKVKAGKTINPFEEQGISDADFKKAYVAFTRPRTGYADSVLTEQIKYFRELKRLFENLESRYRAIKVFNGQNLRNIDVILAARSTYGNDFIIADIAAMQAFCKDLSGVRVPEYKKTAYEWFVNKVVIGQSPYDSIEDLMALAKREKSLYDGLYRLSIDKKLKKMKASA